MKIIVLVHRSCGTECYQLKMGVNLSAADLIRSRPMAQHFEAINGNKPPEPLMYMSCLKCGEDCGPSSFRVIEKDVERTDQPKEKCKCCEDARPRNAEGLCEYCAQDYVGMNLPKRGGLI